MPSVDSLPGRIDWQPPEPRAWAIESATVVVDASVQRLIVVGDLHAYQEPLDAVDAYLQTLTDRHEVFVNGDLFEGGMDAEATVEWVRRHAAGRATRGNHDSRVFAFVRNHTSHDPPDHWAPDKELGAYQRLNAEQLQFLVDLPDQLMVHWRDKTIRILHGHQNPKDTAYTDWRATPEQLMHLFHDTSVDLTVVGHTHYPFVRKQAGVWLANGGSVSVPICRYRTDSGAIEDRCGPDHPFPACPMQSSLLSITESDGQLAVEVVGFDYDRQGLLERYGQRDDLYMRLLFRRVWLMEALFDVELLDGH